MYMYCTGYTGARQYFVMDSTIDDIIAASSTAVSFTTTRNGSPIFPTILRALEVNSSCYNFGADTFCLL